MKTLKAIVAAASILTQPALAAEPVCEGKPLNIGVIAAAIVPGVSMPIMAVERSFDVAKSQFCDHFIPVNGFKVTLETKNVALLPKDPSVCFSGTTGSPTTDVTAVVLKDPHNEVV